MPDEERDGSNGCCGSGHGGSAHGGPVSGMLAGTPADHSLPCCGNAPAAAAGMSGRPVGMLAGSPTYVVARPGWLQAMALHEASSAPGGWCRWRSFLETSPPQPSGGRNGHAPVGVGIDQVALVRPAAMARSHVPIGRVDLSRIGGEPLRPAPTYPERNINRPLRLAEETVIVVTVSYVDRSIDPLGQREFEKIAAALSQLAKANAYVPAGQMQGFNTKLLANGTAYSFAIDMAQYNMMTPVVFDAPDMIDVIKEFNRVNFPPIEAYDHAVLLVPSGMGMSGLVQNASNIGRYGIFNEAFRPAVQVPQHPNAEFAPGFFHELGHGYNLAHASTERLWAEGGQESHVEYGDVFDYMGGVGLPDFRFNATCTAGGSPVPFGMVTEIHLNPIHKWHHGWLPDTAIVKVPPGVTMTYSLDGITSPAGIRALQIEREVDASSGSPISVLVYWRDNEPRSRDGASVALVSREQVAEKTMLLEFGVGAMMGCQRGPAPYVYPAWDAILREDASWTDSVSGAVVTCEGFDSEGRLKVKVDNSAQAGPRFLNFPILDIISPILESGRVITSSDTIVIGVAATNPDKDPGRIGWQDIMEVEASLHVGERMGGQKEAPRLLLPDPTVKGEYETATFFFRTGTEVWAIPAIELRDQASMVFPAFDPIRKLVGLQVKARTYTGPKIIGSRKFLLDQGQL